MENIYFNEKPPENRSKKETRRWTVNNDVIMTSHSSPAPNTAGVKGTAFSKAVRCLVLLCFPLLVVMVVLLCVLLVTRDVELTQIKSANTNLTDERDQLLDTLNNLTDERDQLLDKLNNLHTLHGYQVWKKVGSSFFYYISTEERNWESSRQYCRGVGADLVIINSQEEQKFVALLSGKRVWIGLSDQAAEGVWKWVDGTPLSESYWHSPQPDNHGPGAEKEEDCVESHNRWNTFPLNKWNDMSCNYANIFICEIII